MIELAKGWLEEAKFLRAKLKNLELEPERNIEKINSIKSKLTKLKNAMTTLCHEDQKLICLKYFENAKYKQIAAIMGCHENALYRKLNKVLLEIGRILYCTESDEWKKHINVAVKEQ